jgi:prophage antirepressor-like protein
MDILKALSLLNTEYPINIQGTLDNPIFQANQIGKLLGISNIRENLRDFTNDEKCVSLSNTLTGFKETNFLTELGLYRILGRSRKPIAQVFQKWMINVLKEIRINGMYKLQKDKEIDQKLFKYKCEVASHNIFLKAYHEKNIVYIFKFNTIDDKFVIKIGSTQDIKSRARNISNSYNCQEPLLLEVFECNQYIKFENKIRRNSYISQYYEPIIKTDGTTARETYLVNDVIYAEILKIINIIKLDFLSSNSKEIEELKVVQHDKQIKISELKIQEGNLKLQQLQIECEMKKMELEMTKINEAQFNLITKDENDDQQLTDDDEQPDLEVEDSPVINQVINYIKPRNNSNIVPKIYQYSPDNLQTPIRIFDSPAEAERTLSNVSTPALKRASANNTIYKDYRWLYVNRLEEPPEQIAETVISKYKMPEIRFIAMIDIKKTKILTVYSSQKDAVEARNMKCNSFTRAIQQQHVSSGHYWNFFDECSAEMKNAYLESNALPEPHSNPSGIKIQRIDPLTNNVLSTYNSKRDIVKKYQISYLKLNQLIKNDANEVYNGFIWKTLNS